MKIDIKLIDTNGKVIGVSESYDNLNANECIAKHTGTIDHITYRLLNGTGKSTVEDAPIKVKEGEGITIVPYYPDKGFIELH